MVRYLVSSVLLERPPTDFLPLFNFQILYRKKEERKESEVVQSCLPAMRETWVRSLGWEDPLEKEMATHSSILAWRIPWTEEPGSLQSTGLQRVGHD